MAYFAFIHTGGQVTFFDSDPSTFKSIDIVTISNTIYVVGDYTGTDIVPTELLETTYQDFKLLPLLRTNIINKLDTISHLIVKELEGEDDHNLHDAVEQARVRGTYDDYDQLMFKKVFARDEVHRLTIEVNADTYDNLISYVPAIDVPEIITVGFKVIKSRSFMNRFSITEILAIDLLQKSNKNLWDSIQELSYSPFINMDSVSLNTLMLTLHSQDILDNDPISPGTYTNRRLELLRDGTAIEGYRPELS